MAVLLLALLASGLGAAQACVQRMAWTDAPPWGVRLADGRLGGLQVDYLREVMQRLGCTVEPVELPFSRALLELEQGSIDVLPGLRKTVERERFARYSEPHWPARNLLFVRATDTKRQDPKSLRAALEDGAVVGVLVGAVYSEEYAQLQADPRWRRQLQAGVRLSGLLAMLQRGRVDGVVADEVTAAYELKLLPADVKVVPSKLVVSSGVGLTAFSRSHHDERFVRRFDAAVQELEAQGLMKRLLHAYGVP